MIFLNKIGGAPICHRLLAISLRNLSISSNTPATTNSLIFASSNKETAVSALIARQNNSLMKHVEISGPLWRRKEIFELPLTNKIIENPNQTQKVIEEITNIEKTIDLPTVDNKTGTDIEKQAKNGMIMIRRRKMKKHKLRKLRKKMKYEWAKVRQRREWKKEKKFQAELVAQVKEAESFSAEQYVANKIRSATETPLPRFWKHRRLPQFIIKELVEEEEQKKLKRKYQMWEEYGKQEQKS